MDDDDNLIRQYVFAKSETAFETLCSRYVDLVYSAALRKTGDAHQAEDVTQAVFVVLARKAASLAPRTVLPAWLLTTTRFVANNARRQKLGQRKSAEAAMESNRRRGSEDSQWAEVAPLLDDALAALSDDDRNLVVLRFFQKHPFEAVAGKMGISTDTARKRVERALDKLRGFFTRKGARVGALALAALISEHAVHAAPAGLAAGLSTALAATQAGVQLTPATLMAKGALQAMAIGTATKIGTIAAAALFFMLLGGGLFTKGFGIFAQAQPQAPARTEPTAAVAPVPIPAATPADEQPAAAEVRPAPIPPVPAAPKDDVPVAKAKPEINLLENIDAAADTINGIWRLEKGELQMPSRTCYARLQFPYRPPEEYDYKIEFTVREINEDIVMLCAHGGTIFAWKMGSDDNQACILEDIAGNFGGNNRTKRKFKAVHTVGKRRTAVVQVRETGLTATLDGEVLLKYPTDYKELRLTNAWRLADTECLGIGCFITPFTLHAATVTEITGRGSVLRAPGDKPAPRYAAPSPDEAWAQAVDLLPMIDTKRDTVAGTWTANEKGLACKAEAFARLEIPFKPPEEYDYKIVFKYASGTPEVHQFVSAGNKTFHWCLDGWKNKNFNEIASFQSFDRYPKDIWNPSSAILPGFFKPVVPHTSIVQIRRTSATAYLDGELVSQLVIGYGDAHVMANWTMPTRGILGVGSNNCAIEIQKLALLEITGKGLQVDAEAMRTKQPGAPVAPPKAPKAEGF